MKFIAIGADPELFLNDQFSGLIIPATGLVGGTKTTPLPLTEDGFFVQEDNVLVEFNIPPANTENGFVENIRKGMQLLHTHVGRTGHGLEIKASHFFSPDDLTTQEACEFGCTPDFNAYTGKVNPPPNGEETLLRTSSGHLHFSYESPTNDDNKALVRALDITHGVPSVLMDSDRERRQLYGKAGCYRDKPYGFEYRSLSSFWLNSEGKVRWAWKGAERAFKEVKEFMNIPEEDVMLIQEAINNYDEDKATHLVEKYKLQIA